MVSEQLIFPEMVNESSAQTEIQSQIKQAGSSNNSSATELITGDVISLVNRLVSDPSSPYYLHYGDNTGMQLIFVTLTNENYATWSHAMVMALSVKNKKGFIDGSIVKPPLDYPLYGAWRRCNYVVSSWIINSIPKELYRSVMHKDSARQIWIELRDRYSQSNRPRIYELNKQIASIT